MKQILVFVMLLFIFWVIYRKLITKEQKEGFAGDDCTVIKRIRRNDGVLVEIVNAECKEGLPHTTGPKTFRITKDKWDGDRKDSIVKHEYVHLWQKSHPMNWAKFYKDAWGYDLLAQPPPDIDPALLRALRPNPDTAAAPWALWKNKYLFFPIYSDGTRKLTNAKVIVWNTETRAVEGIPEEWRRFFCVSNKCPSQFEHPHEIAAELYTEEIMSPATPSLLKFIKTSRK